LAKPHLQSGSDSNTIKKLGSIKLLFAVALSVLLLQSVLVSVHHNSVGDLCINYNYYTNIIALSCNANLSEINQVINDGSILEKAPLGVWVLKAIIKVNPMAQLTIDQTDTSWLKITNKNNTEPNFISVSGALKVDGIKMTSWDPSSKNVIRQNVNGSIPRPYIVINRAYGSANISNSEVAFLGYASRVGGTNGLLYYHGGNGSSILNNTFHDMLDGFYSTAVASVTIKDNKYYNNLRDGIDPHSGSHDLNIIGNLVYDNHKIGIICSQDCYNILFSNNVVHDNRLAGLMFSIDTNNSIAKNNYAYHEKIGISIYQSSNDRVYNNIVKSSNIGIYTAGSCMGNQVYNNALMNGTLGIYLHLSNNSKNNLFKNNHMDNISQPLKQIPVYPKNTLIL
jgi:mannuronan 5-epimerase